MNFILLKNGMSVFDKISNGTDFLGYLGKKEFGKSGETVYGVKISRIDEEDYAGYGRKKNRSLFDLVWTKTVLKDLKNMASDDFVRLLLEMIHNDFTPGKRLRQQGEMKSVVIPGNRKQKVLLFSTLEAQEFMRQAHVLIGVGKASEWNSHGKAWSSRNDFAGKASQRQKYYAPIYRKALEIMK